MLRFRDDLTTEGHTVASMVVGDMHIAKFLVESCARNHKACGS